MDAIAFLEVAERSLNTEADEATRRTAASRAYYAAYHYANPIVDLSMLPTGSMGSHERVIRALRLSGHHEAELQSQILRELKTERTTADYVLTVSFSLLRAQNAVIKARTFCEWAESIVANT